MQRFNAGALPVVSSLSASVTNLVNPKVLSTSLGAISKLLVTLALGVAAASRGLLDPSTLTVSWITYFFLEFALTFKAKNKPNTAVFSDRLISGIVP